MTFADITIVPVPSDHKDTYLTFSKRMSDVYRDHGATRVTDYWQVGPAANQSDYHADGAPYEQGQFSVLANVAGASDSESVVVTIMEWPSQEARDKGVAAATKDPRVLATLHEDPVFDGRRVIGESFEVTMSLSAND